jgi:hypothetical protein
MRISHQDTIAIYSEKNDYISTPFLDEIFSGYQL